MRRRRISGKASLFFLCGLVALVYVTCLSSVSYQFHEASTTPSSLWVKLQQFNGSTTPNTSLSDKERLIPFLNKTQLSIQDPYSASWLQPVDQFLTMKLENIDFLEDASFLAFQRNDARRMLRMTPDWLDFCVEHLSKWWKILDIFQHATVYRSLMRKLQAYLSKSPNYPIDTSFQQTIAVIPFIQLRDKNDKQHKQAYQLTKYTLAATIESLRRAGFGRIVVSGLDPSMEETICQDTFRLWKGYVEQTTLTATKWVAQVGRTEIAYVPAPAEHAHTKPDQYFEKNIPRAALWGLRDALRIAQVQTSQLTTNETVFVQKWLGTARETSYWKHVYFSEADSVLQTRHTTLPLLRKQFRMQSTVLVPHRLQIVPHASDLTEGPPLPPTKDHLYLPNHTGSPFEHVMELDALHPRHDACCDEFRGREFRPGNMNKTCDNFWFMCHFNTRVPKEQRTHANLQHYALIRLTQGTGIVSLASLNSGRRCIPHNHSICKPPYASPNRGSIFLPFP